MKTPTYSLPSPDMAQALSCWMDGAALPDGCNEQQLLDWLLASPEAQAKWADWHAASHLLQYAESAATSGTLLPAGWLAGLQVELSHVAVASMHEPVVTDSASLAGTSVQLPAAHGVRPLPARLDTQPANQPVWRWKLAAGFASMAAAGMLAWNLLPVTGTAPAGALASSQQVVQREGVPSASLVADSLTSAGEHAAPVVDQEMDALLVAHAQFGAPSLMVDGPSPAEEAY